MLGSNQNYIQLYIFNIAAMLLGSKFMVLQWVCGAF